MGRVTLAISSMRNLAASESGPSVQTSGVEVSRWL